ncbi:MAG TPA: IPT/TIG domain-containing protein [Thermoanaerobaculia bacterium]|nr:IPT/TIG domain-containing protein [Thermoanaerobaculia bacterium]
MRIAKALAVLFFTSAAMANPVITSVTPRFGPVTGGTTVQIHGTGFSNNCITCSPPFGDPQVYFGSALAPSVRYMSPTLIEAVTPPHVPVDVSVSVYQADGSDPGYDVLNDAFSFEGDVYTAFDPLLFPIFMPPVPGQAGSEFVTTARLWNKGLTGVTFFGYDRTCTLIDPPVSATDRFGLDPRQEYELTLWPECSDSIAKLFFVPKGNKSLAASLRVSETSKQAQNHGVEIPVVRLEDFSEESIALLDVPVDPKFRLTMRIYGLNRGSNFVNVSFGNRSLQVPLQHGRTIFEPSYAVVTDFAPADTAPPSNRQDSMTVLLDSPRGPGDVGSPIWAFITVTNNETQHITTITPQQ